MISAWKKTVILTYVNFAHFNLNRKRGNPSQHSVPCDLTQLKRIAKRKCISKFRFNFIHWTLHQLKLYRILFIHFAFWSSPSQLDFLIEYDFRLISFLFRELKATSYFYDFLLLLKVHLLF